jgi:hypothetical protein
LKTIHLDRSDWDEDIMVLQSFPNLKSFSLQTCLETDKILPALPKLRKLRVHRRCPLYPQPVFFDDLPHYTGLISLDLSSSWFVQDLKNIAKLPRLQTLKLRRKLLVCGGKKVHIILPPSLKIFQIASTSDLEFFTATGPLTLRVGSEFQSKHPVRLPPGAHTLHIKHHSVNPGDFVPSTMVRHIHTDCKRNTHNKLMFHEWSGLNMITFDFVSLISQESLDFVQNIDIPKHVTCIRFIVEYGSQKGQNELETLCSQRFPNTIIVVRNH